MTNKFTLILILFFPLIVKAGKNEKCPEVDLKAFKQYYVNLLNEMKVSGRDVELSKDGNKIIAKKNDNSADGEFPGDKVELELYKHYSNALVKIAKAYQVLQKDDSQKNLLKTLNANKSYADFFQAINPISKEQKKISNDFRLYDFLAQIQKVNVNQEFKISNSDIYFLTKLFTHSQDKICTQKKYSTKKNAKSIEKNDYMDGTLNNIINSLKELTKNESLLKTDEDETILQAIKENIAKMKEITKKPECINQLKAMGTADKLVKIFGEDRNIQPCNYDLFLNSLNKSDFENFDSILHFINANKNANDAATGLNWILGHISEPSKIPVCNKESSNVYYISNFNFTDFKDEDVTCTFGNVQKNGQNCLNFLDNTPLNQKGYKLTLKNSTSKDFELSIAGSPTCSKLKFESSDKKQIEPQNENSQNSNSSNCSIEACDIAKIPESVKNKYESVSWDEKQQACVGKNKLDKNKSEIICSINTNKPEQKPTDLTEKEKCEAKNKEYISKPDEGEVRTDKYIWDGKTCIDKTEKKNAEANPEEGKEPVSNVQNANNVPQSRYQNIPIPSRQIYVLPGMP